MTKYMLRDRFVEAVKWYPPDSESYVPGTGVVSQGPDKEGKEGLCGCSLVGHWIGSVPHLHPGNDTLRAFRVFPGDYIVTYRDGRRTVIEKLDFEQRYTQGWERVQ